MMVPYAAAFPQWESPGLRSAGSAQRAHARLLRDGSAGWIRVAGAVNEVPRPVRKSRLSPAGGGGDISVARKLPGRRRKRFVSGEIMKNLSEPAQYLWTYALHPR